MTCPTFGIKPQLLALGLWLLAKSQKQTAKSGFPYIAAAPLTISMISFVIFAWRARFMIRVNESIMSVALLVAESIAVIRAACSAATDSNSARKIWMLTYFGSSARNKFAGDCS